MNDQTLSRITEPLRACDPWLTAIERRSSPDHLATLALEKVECYELLIQHG